MLNRQDGSDKGEGQSLVIMRIEGFKFYKAVR